MCGWRYDDTVVDGTGRNAGLQWLLHSLAFLGWMITTWKVIWLVGAQGTRWLPDLNVNQHLTRPNCHQAIPISLCCLRVCTRQHSCLPHTYKGHINAPSPTPLLHTARLPTRAKADGAASAPAAPSVPLPGSASASEVRVWLSGLVEDLLAALPLPEWPGAGVLLRRLVLAIGSSSKEWQGWLLHADMGVRGVCVELLGTVARALCALGREVEAPEVAREVARIVEEAAGGRLWGVCGV